MPLLLRLVGSLVLAAPVSAARAGAPGGRDCPPVVGAPVGLPAHGGTVTVHPGIPRTCIVRLPGGVVLRADGDTAAPYTTARPHGRAIFRISGVGLDPPGVNIVVSRSDSDAANGPETLPYLAADARIILPPGAVLVRFDPVSGRFVPVPGGHLRQAGDTLYKIIRRGASPVPLPAPPVRPTTLPATGGSPLSVLLILAAAVLVAGLWLGHGALPLGRRGRRMTAHGAARRPRGLALGAGGVLLVAAWVLFYAAAQTRPAPRAFGTLADTGAAPPRQAGASGPPTRLVIPRLGIDTPVIALGIAGGMWQVPAYAAGYLAGSAWPGRSGNEAISGHDDRDGAVFRQLGDVRPHDMVLVYAGHRAYRYTVTALRVVPATRVDVLRPTRGATLTLITCFPYLIDTERLVVRAQILP